MKLKEQGNAAFKASKYSDAITFYEEALIQVKFRKDDIEKENLTEEERIQLKPQEEELFNTHQALLNNLAQCFQKKNKLDESMFYNEQCLAINPHHMKARYRKVHLLQSDSQFEEALFLAKELAVEDPGQFKNLIKEIENALK